MTTMTKVKVSDLTGAQLDWAVAVALGHTAKIEWGGECRIIDWNKPGTLVNGAWFEPHKDWQDGGPIIEREHGRIETGDLHTSEFRWTADMGHGTSRYRSYGPTPLIAAMRAFVASKLGDEVEVPTAEPEPDTDPEHDKICPDWNGSSCKHGCKNNCGIPF